MTQAAESEITARNGVLVESEPFGSVGGVRERLCGDGAHTGLDPWNDGSGTGLMGGNTHPQLTTLRVMGDDRERHGRPPVVTA